MGYGLPQGGGGEPAIMDNPGVKLPWAELVERLGHTPEERGTSTAASTVMDTPTPSSMRHRPYGPSSNSPRLRESIRETEGMSWLVTRRLNSKDH